MKRNVVFLSILALSAVILTVGCPRRENEAIRIGVAGAHSGDLAAFGLPTVNAARLVIEQINANGGINGRMLELIVADDQCKPELATNAASKLVSDNVVAVIGHICSGATRAALGIYKDSNILAISPSSTNPPLTQSGEFPNFFRTIAPDDAQARLAATFIKEKLGLTKLAILHDKGDYGKGFAELVKGYVEGYGIQVLLFEGITPGAPDYSAVINKIGDAGVEGVVWGGYHPEASRLVQQMRDKGLEYPFIGADGIMGNTFIELAGRYAEGVYATGPMDTSANPMAIKAIADHQAKFGEAPGSFFLNAYAATIAVTNAIAKAGSTDYEALVKVLRSEYVETPIGRISFDERGDVVGFGFSVFQVQNGNYVELK